MNLMRVKTAAPGLRGFRSQRLMAAPIAYRQVPLFPTPEDLYSVQQWSSNQTVSWTT